MRALDGVSTRSLEGFGCGSLCRGPLHLGSRMGSDQGIYPWVSTLVMGSLMGRRFWVGRVCFFSGWGGGGKWNSSDRKAQTFFAGRLEFQTALGVCYILYVEQWGFHCSLSSDHHSPRSATDSTEQWV
jgi:hypothetical protein